MDFQEKQRRRREEQLAADNHKRAEKRAAMQAPPHDNPADLPPSPAKEPTKIQIESTKYVPTIPEYALKIEFGGLQKGAPLTAYNRFKLLTTPESNTPSASPEIHTTPNNGEEEST